MHTSTSIPIQHWLFRKVKQWFNQQKKQGQKSIKIKATPQTVIVCCTGKDSFHIKERNKSGCFVFCLYPWDHVRHIAVKSSYLNEYFPPLVHCISTKLLKVSKTVDAEKKKKKKKAQLNIRSLRYLQFSVSPILAYIWTICPSDLSDVVHLRWVQHTDHLCLQHEWYISGWLAHRRTRQREWERRENLNKHGGRKVTVAASHQSHLCLYLVSKPP